MGLKGNKHSNEAQLSAELFVERLATIGDITSKKMFGAYGIFHGGKMFGIINSEGQVFLKIDEILENTFKEAGAKKHDKMPYYSIPEDVLDGDEFLDWAKKSITISKA